MSTRGFQLCVARYWHRLCIIYTHTENIHSEKVLSVLYGDAGLNSAEAREFARPRGSALNYRMRKDYNVLPSETETVVRANRAGSPCGIRSRGTFFFLILLHRHWELSRCSRLIEKYCPPVFSCPRAHPWGKWGRGKSCELRAFEARAEWRKSYRTGRNVEEGKARINTLMCII